MITFSVEITDKYAGKTRTYWVTAPDAQAAETICIVRFCNETGAYWIPESYFVRTREGVGHANAN